MSSDAPQAANNQVPSPARLRLLAWKAQRQNTLRGFATVELPNGLRIIDCPVLEAAGKRWAALPGKAQIEAGRQRLDAHGKPAYAPVLQWREVRLREAFSARIVEVVQERHLGAFDGAE